ncbi:hypothetical protein PENTCL1PPCAC_21682 [Pristionchus entomophagus]|uniref:BTB domain-containing protein n=1 Tax=Pristionchus entomophagus TaxID=358040 RepID=A0AAV5TYS2_9BILA|nr:hypothetical protein PENTCL1PPCAC_21682 [Pristionchus entomophagus]
MSDRVMEKEGAAAAAANSKSGIIRFVIDNVSTLNNGGQYSPEVEVGGVSWRGNCYKSAVNRPNPARPVHNNSPGVALGICSMHKQSTLWNIDIDAQFILVNSDTTKNITAERTRYFGHETSFTGAYLLPWEEVMNNEKGFIKDDKVEVEIRFSITRMKGIKTTPPLFDFTNSNDSRHDIALVINGEKIYASKAILASYSPVFLTMFNGDFDEKNNNEIVLKEIDRDELIEMLHVIYPTHKKISDESAEFLLKLGDRFLIPYVMDRSEKFLIFSSMISNTEKLRIADHYRLFGLQCHCLSKLVTRQNFLDVKESTIYTKLSCETKSALFERMLKIPQ